MKTLKEEITQAIDEFSNKKVDLIYKESDGRELKEKILAIVGKKVDELKSNIPNDIKGENTFGWIYNTIDSIFGDVHNSNFVGVAENQIGAVESAQVGSSKLTQTQAEQNNSQIASDKVNSECAPLGVLLSDDDRQEILDKSWSVKIQKHLPGIVVDSTEQAVLKKVEAMIDELEIYGAVSVDKLKQRLRGGRG